MILHATVGALTNDRLLHILDRLAADTDRGVTASASLCETAVEMLDLSGSALMLMDGGARQRSIAVSGELMGVIEDLQHTYGEGPCVEAYHLGAPVLEPDLVETETVRWIGFTAPAVTAGARAVFGFPLRVGAVRFGALNLCSDQSGSLTDRQHADALLLADVATHAILALQADAPLHSLAAELEDVGNHQLTVHQATGMVAVQLGAGIADALARLRAHAFTTDRSISAVAADIVARRLRLEP